VLGFKLLVDFVELALVGVEDMLSSESELI